MARKNLLGGGGAEGIYTITDRIAGLEIGNRRRVGKPPGD